MYKTTLSTYHESETILRGSAKFISTMRMAFISRSQSYKSFEPLCLNFLISILPLLIYFHQYRT